MRQLPPAAAVEADALPAAVEADALPAAVEPDALPEAVEPDALPAAAEPDALHAAVPAKVPPRKTVRKASPRGFDYFCYMKKVEFDCCFWVLF